jgi:ubiquinone/menaquinone biosynthesis C-methylase UbiE
MSKTSRNLSALDTYAHEYDWITNAVAREPNHDREVAALVEAFTPSSVLDAGCATGLTSRLFAQRGILTVGLDRSRRMLEQARLKTGSEERLTSFRYGTFERLPNLLNRRFDLVVCLANSITGVETLSGLRSALSGFLRVLRPGGTLVIQMLNFEALKPGQIMPVKATVNEGVVWTRYSVRRGKKLQLHIVRVDLKAQPPSTEAFIHEFDNFTPEQVMSALKKTGFTNQRTYGNLLLTKRFGKRARDFVVAAQRPD